jgi:hypothetical protein
VPDAQTFANAVFETLNIRTSGKASRGSTKRNNVCRWTSYVFFSPLNYPQFNQVSFRVHLFQLRRNGRVAPNDS